MNTPETNSVVEKHDEADPMIGASAGYKDLLDHARTLERQRDELVRALEYLAISTAPDGQWADQAVKSFVEAALASVKGE